MLAALGAPLLPLGCARFQPAPLSAEATADLFDSRSLTNSKLKEFVNSNLSRPALDSSPQTWDFEMLTLAALYYSPALDVARAQWLVAEGGRTTAAARPNPTLNVTPTYNFTTITPSPWLPLGSIEMPIETAGKRRYRRERAARQSDAARFAVLATAWQTRAQLRAALEDFLAAEQRRRQLQAQVSLNEQLLAKIEQQVRAGAVAGSETLNLRLALAKARFDSAENDRLSIEARARVAAAVGVPLSALEGIRLEYDPPMQDELIARLSSAEVRRLALTSRPDILAGLAEYGAAESALRLEIARQYPDLKLAPGYEYDQGDSKWSLGITVDLPLLNQNQGPIAEAKARRAEAAARFTAVQSAAVSEIDRSVAVLKATSANAAMVRGIAEQQRAKRDSVATQVKAGAAQPTDFLSAQIELSGAELAEVESQIKVRQVLGALEDAVQRPFSLPADLLTQGVAHGF